MNLQQQEQLKQIEDYLAGAKVDGDEGGAFLPLFVIVRQKCIEAMTDNSLTDKQIAKLLSIDEDTVAKSRGRGKVRKAA
jgi:hypothetical protein